jgi:hypothetical protein
LMLKVAVPISLGEFQEEALPAYGRAPDLVAKPAGA